MQCADFFKMMTIRIHNVETMHCNVISVISHSAFNVNVLDNAAS